MAWTFEPTGRSGGGRVRRQKVSDQMALLARAPLFEGLPQSHLRKIAKVSTSWRGRAGDELVKEGAAGSTLYVIVDGEAKVTKNGRTVKRLGRGDFVGEMAILTKAPRSASVVAETDVVCLVLSATNLRKVLKEEPTIGVRMLDVLAQRLAEMDRLYTA
jgi:CRP-like cAMP-binding protein